MSRLATLDRSDLSPEAQKSWDLVALNGKVAGPFQILIRTPRIAEVVRELATAVRESDLLTPADRELAILTMAQAFEAEFVIVSHEPTARRVGVRASAIAAALDPQQAGELETRERIIVETARSLARTHRLDDALYARASSEFGESALVELVALIGFYGCIGDVLGAFAGKPASP